MKETMHEWFVRDLKTWTKLLEDDFYGNILQVLKSMQTQTKSITSNLDKIFAEMANKQLTEHMVKQLSSKEKP